MDVSFCTAARVGPSAASDRELVSEIVGNGTKLAVRVGEQSDLSLDGQVLATRHITDKNSSSIGRPGIARK